MILIFLLAAVQSKSWNYNQQTEKAWGSECFTTDRSPRPIDSSSASKISSSLQMKMVFLGYTGAQKIINTGNLIRIQTNIGYIEVGDMDGRRNFNVKYIDFHVPSEHKVDGTFFPLEIQIICSIQDKYWERDEPNMAIVSVIVQRGKESYFLNMTEIKNWPSSGQNYTTSSESNLNLRELYTNTEEYLHYSGTATNPDLRCQDNVLWYIIKDVKEAADWQISIIENLFSKGSSRELNDSPPTLYHSYSRLLCFFMIGIIL